MSGIGHRCLLGLNVCTDPLRKITSAELHCTSMEDGVCLSNVPGNNVSYRITEPRGSKLVPEWLPPPEAHARLA